MGKIVGWDTIDTVDVYKDPNQTADPIPSQPSMHEKLNSADFSDDTVMHESSTDEESHLEEEAIDVEHDIAESEEERSEVNDAEIESCRNERPESSDTKLQLASFTTSEPAPQPATQTETSSNTLHICEMVANPDLLVSYSQDLGGRYSTDWHYYCDITEATKRTLLLLVDSIKPTKLDAFLISNALQRLVVEQARRASELEKLVESPNLNELIDYIRSFITQ